MQRPPPNRARYELSLDKLASRAVTGGVAVMKKTRGGRFLVDTLVAAMTVAHGFRGEKISLRASALTYITMLSLVPLLAVAFAIVRAIGQEPLRKAVHGFIFDNLAPGAREQTAVAFNSFIDNASSGALGGVGGVMLVISAVSLLHNVEKSVNEIWAVTRTRSTLQRAVMYWSLLTLGPLALSVSLFATSTFTTLLGPTAVATLSIASVASWLITVLGFSFLYLIAPNAKVRFRAALGGGFVAGSAWELAKHGYAVYATRTISYSAIYGSLAAIPLFLVWVYVSWLIVLFGARLAYALQYAIDTPIEMSSHEPRTREVLCARVLLEAVADFVREAPAPSLVAVGERLKLDEGHVQDAVRELVAAELLAQTATGGLVPARPPERITVDDLARAVKGTYHPSAEPPAVDEAAETLVGLFRTADGLARARLAKVTFAELAKARLKALQKDDSPTAPQAATALKPS